MIYSPQVFPGTLLPHTYPDPDNPGRLVGRSEVERRADYIQLLREQLGEQHSFLQLVCQCLHNTPAQRPSAENLLQQLEPLRPQIKGEFSKLQVAMMSVLETEMEEKIGEIEHLRRDLRQVQVYTSLETYGSFLCSYAYKIDLPCYVRWTEEGYR